MHFFDKRVRGEQPYNASLPFLQALFEPIEETLGTSYQLRFRMDGDYFEQAVLEGRTAALLE